MSEDRELELMREIVKLQQTIIQLQNDKLALPTRVEYLTSPSGAIPAAYIPGCIS